MKRPKQLPAVDRNLARCASAPVGAHVNASGFWDVVGGIAKVARPLVAGAV